MTRIDNDRYHTLRFQQERQASLSAADPAVAAVHSAMADLYQAQLIRQVDPGRSTEDTPLIQRAIEVAREGRCKMVSDIARQLKREGYELAHQHLSAPTLKKQLNALIRGKAAGNGLR